MSYFHDTYIHATPLGDFAGHIFRFKIGAVAFDRYRFSLYLFGRLLIDRYSGRNIFGPTPSDFFRRIGMKRSKRLI